MLNSSRFLALTGLLITLAPSAAEAQARTQTRERAGAPPARSVRAQPSAEAALLVPAIQAARESVEARPKGGEPAPAPLSPTLKRQALAAAGSPGAAAGSRVAAPSQALESVRLSARRPHAAGKAYLSAFQPSDFNAEQDVLELNINYGGWINVHLNVEAGVSYLVDLSTTTWGSGGTWRIAIGDEVIEIDKGPGQEHVLFAVQAPVAGWVRAEIRRTGTGCRIHEVQIDRAN